jgi:tight adherence protein C
MGVPLEVILASAAVAAALPILFWGFAGLGRGKPTVPGLEGERPAVTDQRQLNLQEPTVERVVRPALRSLARRARGLTPAGWVRALERRVRLAGSPTAWSVERVLAAKLLLGTATLVVGFLWLARFFPKGEGLVLTLGRVLLIPLVAVIAYFLPDLLLGMKGSERQRSIQVVLPDALDQMSISVEAGVGFDGALQRVIEAGEGPLVEELRRTIREISIGVARKQAFRNLLDRTDVPELRHFVFAVSQAEEYGLPIANVLRVQAKELRVIRRQRAEERAMKIPVKIVFPLVLCIFPSMFVVILVPAAIRIFDTLIH